MTRALWAGRIENGITAKSMDTKPPPGDDDADIVITEYHPRAALMTANKRELGQRSKESPWNWLARKAILLARLIASTRA